VHIIITRLTLKPGCDWDELSRKVSAFDVLACAASSEFQGVSLIRNGDEEATLFVQFATRNELDRVSREIAGPWFTENVKSLLAGPVNGSVGEVVAGRLVA
jgi:hypothetical protein